MVTLRTVLHQLHVILVSLNKSPSYQAIYVAVESSIANDRKVLSRWDEIRAANATGPKSTSWDVLRQQRDSDNGGRDKRPSEQDPSIQYDDQAERMQEQARFDALLEAERRLSRA